MTRAPSGPLGRDSLMVKIEYGKSDKWRSGHCCICKKELKPQHPRVNGTATLLDEVLARPDPLEVLEKWTHNAAPLLDGWEEQWNEYKSILEDIRTNPDAVIKRGKSEGWL